MHQLLTINLRRAYGFTLDETFDTVAKMKVIGVGRRRKW